MLVTIFGTVSAFQIRQTGKTLSISVCLQCIAICCAVKQVCTLFVLRAGISAFTNNRLPDKVRKVRSACLVRSHKDKGDNDCWSPYLKNVSCLRLLIKGSQRVTALILACLSAALTMPDIIPACCTLDRVGLCFQNIYRSTRAWAMTEKVSWRQPLSYRLVLCTSLSVG